MGNRLVALYGEITHFPDPDIVRRDHDSARLLPQSHSDGRGPFLQAKVGVASSGHEWRALERMDAIMRGRPPSPASVNLTCIAGDDCGLAIGQPQITTDLTLNQRAYEDSLNPTSIWYLSGGR